MDPKLGVAIHAETVFRSVVQKFINNVLSRSIKVLW